MPRLQKLRFVSVCFDVNVRRFIALIAEKHKPIASDSQDGWHGNPFPYSTATIIAAPDGIGYDPHCIIRCGALKGVVYSL